MNPMGWEIPTEFQVFILWIALALPILYFLSTTKAIARFLLAIMPESIFGKAVIFGAAHSIFVICCFFVTYGIGTYFVCFLEGRFHSWYSGDSAMLIFLAGVPIVLLSSAIYCVVYGRKLFGRTMLGPFVASVVLGWFLLPLGALLLYLLSFGSLSHGQIPRMELHKLPILLACLIDGMETYAMLVVSIFLSSTIGVLISLSWRKFLNA